MGNQLPKALPFPVVAVNKEAKPGSPAMATPTSLISSGMIETLQQTQEVAKTEKTEKSIADMLKGESPEDIIAEITSDGMRSFMKWKVKDLEKRITEKVMNEMHITEVDLAAMAPQQRLDTENLIRKAVQEQLKMAMEEQMKKDAKNPLTAMVNIPMFDKQTLTM